MSTEITHISDAELEKEFKRRQLIKNLATEIKLIDMELLDQRTKFVESEKRFNTRIQKLSVKKEKLDRELKTLTFNQKFNEFVQS